LNFLAENQRLVERCEHLVRKLLDIRKQNDSLRAENEEVERAKRLCEEELLSLQQVTDKDLFQSGEALAQLQNSIVQLIAQTKEELSERG